ncbi:MAG: hypothetical protein EHM20_09205, partial [Alphaproteobacteria bacterium]
RDEYRNSEPVIVELEFSLLNKIENLVVGIDLKRDFGEFVFRSFHNDMEEVLNFHSNTENKYRLRVEIPSMILNGGSYYIYPCAGVHRKKWLVGGEKNIKGISFSVSFNVPNPDYVYVKKRPGMLSPILNWWAANKTHHHN